MIGRRGFVTGVAALLAAPALAAPSIALAQGAERRFPHPYGETVVTGTPKRIVSAGYNTQDALLALGITPVALRYWYGPYADGIWPWAQGLVEGTPPVVSQGEIPIETMAGLAADLIVAIGSGMSKDEYDLLSRIAPVLLQPPEVPAYGMAWDAGMRLVGEAVGKPAEAEALIAGVNARFAAIRARHPDWAGLTAVPAWHDGGQTGAFLAQDLRAQFLTQLGFRTSPALEALAGSSFYTTFSPEDLSALDADVIVWISAEARAGDLTGLPMRQTLRAVREGREVFAGELLAGAMSFGSVLSYPWAIDRIEAELVAALDGDPATPVPSAVAAGLTP